MSSTPESENPDSPRARIQELPHLPPLAPVAQELLLELNREEIDINRLCRIIERDPGLTARLIGVANSAYFSQREPIYDLSTAIIRVLGLNLVKSLSLGIALSAPFDTRACPAFPLDHYWCLAMLTSTLASQLASQAKLEPGANEYLFLGGLLHNLGDLVLAHCFPKQLCEVLRQADANPATPLEALQQNIIGLRASEAGVMLGHKWHLPERILHIISHHHDYQYRGESWRTVCLIGYCSRLIRKQYCTMESEAVPDLISNHNVLELPENAVAAALERLRSKGEQTHSLARTLAGGVA
ncbi:MAG TPA: HDOD domain-containing protein [Gammaproteobacteria bacterium]|nr:HDOD domain-containing protein [Gammaproteobacteria bacterium]